MKKKPKDIPARLLKLEEEMRTLRGALQQDRDASLRELPDPVEVLVGSVGDVWVALPVSSIREVLPRVYLQAAPESPAYLAGYMNWRGIPVPVIDPSARWGTAPLPLRLEDRIVIVDGTSGFCALLFSQVEQIASIAHAMVGRIPEEIPAAPYAIGLWYSGDRSIVLIAPDRLVDPAELGRYETA